MKAKKAGIEDKELWFKYELEGDKDRIWIVGERVEV
jgi:hypothetical protein